MEKQSLDNAMQASIWNLLTPPLIRQSMSTDEKLRGKFNAELDALIGLGANQVSIWRSVLFTAARTVLTNGGDVEVKDHTNHIWTLNHIQEGDGPPNLVLSSDEQRYVLPDLSVLAPNSSIRIESLSRIAAEVRLPQASFTVWEELLTSRPLEDEEVDAFYNDVRDNPIHVAHKIHKEVGSGEGNIATFVPNSRRYFNRLIGVYDNNQSVKDYAQRVAHGLFSQHSDLDPYAGFFRSLLLSSHSAITKKINIDHLDNEGLVKAFESLVSDGDMLSRIGAIEVGLRVLTDRPEVKPSLLRLIHLIRDDQIDGERSEFRLLSALFVLVDGELARTRLLSDTPPFYRRLASLAQAALIHRQLLRCRVDYAQFIDWALRNRSIHFYMQNITDMRVEPYWNPEMADAYQVQADFIGRIIHACNACNLSQLNGDLVELVLGEGEGSLYNKYDFPSHFFPGPLEGDETYKEDLPDTFASTIEKQLGEEKADVNSFIALINSAHLFRMPSDKADTAGNLIKMSNYTISNLTEKPQLVSILQGLSTVAARSRNPALADEIRILVRRYRRDSEFTLLVQEAFIILLMASAAYYDLAQWAQCVGDCMTELAFGELNGDEGKILHSHLTVLLDLVPELWITCGRADAALCALVHC